jgi:hypothetical protein
MNFVVLGHIAFINSCLTSRDDGRRNAGTLSELGSGFLGYSDVTPQRKTLSTLSSSGPERAKLFNNANGTHGASLSPQ